MAEVSTQQQWSMVSYWPYDENCSQSHRHHNSITHQLFQLRNETSLRMQANCGAGQWYRVTFLNMSNHSQQCPSAWRLYNSGGVRACGRLDSSGASCSSKFYSTAREYSRVCGRAIGYQYNSSDGFNRITTTLQNQYMDSVSITHGEFESLRSHI